MAITPEKVNFNNINEVKLGDGIMPSLINAPLKASAYAQEVTTRNSNKITAVENALIKVGTLAKQDGTLTEETQRTGGTGLLDFTIVDNSYATVKKIQGNTILSGDSLVNAKFKGIKITGKNWFNPNLLLVPNGWTENDGVYSGAIGNIYNVYKDTMGGLLKINTSGQVTVSFVGKNDTKNAWTFGIGFVYTDGTGTSDSERLWISSTNFEKYSITSKEGKNVDFIYVSYANGDIVYLKDFCVRLGTDGTYISYEENFFTLDNTIELGKWDYVENDKIVKETTIEPFDETKYDEVLVLYNGTPYFILSLDNSKVAFRSNTSITPIKLNFEYLAWDKGQEIMQLENEAVPQVTNEYFVVLGGAK